MFIDCDDLFLVGGEFFGVALEEVSLVCVGLAREGEGYLESDKDGVRFGYDAHDY